MFHIILAWFFSAKFVKEITLSISLNMYVITNASRRVVEDARGR